MLDAALQHVPKLGFTREALVAGAEDVGYLTVSHNLFPAGAFTLVHYHLAVQREALQENFERPTIDPVNNKPPADLTSRILAIVQHRLLANERVISHLPHALAQLSLAGNLRVSTREMSLLVDEILYLAGSTTVTSAWYSDRAGLATIYAAAELYMTQDRSSGFLDTLGFTSRALLRAHRLRSSTSMLAAWSGMQAGGLLDGLRSKGVWI